MTNEEVISTLITIKMLFDNTYARKALDVAIETLKERPHGSWKPTIKFIQFTCSKCGAAYSSDYNYCPNCGAAMDISE